MRWIIRLGTFPRIAGAATPWAWHIIMQPTAGQKRLSVLCSVCAPVYVQTIIASHPGLAPSTPHGRPSPMHHRRGSPGVCRLRTRQHPLGWLTPTPHGRPSPMHHRRGSRGVGWLRSRHPWDLVHLCPGHRRDPVVPCQRHRGGNISPDGLGP